MEQADTTPKRHRARNAALYASAAILALGAAGWFARKPIAAGLLEYYLAERGVNASVEIQRLDFGGIEAKAISGKDFSVEKIEIVFDPHGWFVAKSVRLDKPFLRVGYDGKTLSFGSLQHLIDSLTRRTAATGTVASAPASKLEIIIGNGTLEIATPAGTIEAHGNGSMSGRTAMAFDGAVKPGRLHSKDFDADILDGTAHVESTKDGLNLHLALKGNATSPSKTQPFQIANGDIVLDAPHLILSTAQGGAQQISGPFTVTLSASNARISNIEIANLHSEIHIAGTAATDRSYDLHISGIAAGDLPEESARNLVRRVPILGSDKPNAKAMLAALRSLTLDAPDLHAVAAGRQTSVTLGAPLTLTGSNNAVLRVTPVGDAPLLQMDGAGTRGGAAINLSGRGLPVIALAMPSYTNSHDNGLDAQIELAARFSAMGLQNANVHMNGHVTRNGDTIAYRPDNCASVTLSAFVSGRQTRLHHGRGKLCAGGPMFTLDSKGWRLQARWQDAAAAISGSDSAAVSKSGRIELVAGGKGLKTGLLDIEDARLTDLLRPIRYRTLSATGHVALADNMWRGTIALSGARKQRFGTVSIEHSMRDNSGRAIFAARNIAFAVKGLQPTDISPLLAAITRAQGTASFDAEVTWSSRGMKSGGVMDIAHLDFASPLGPASNANARLHFISLIPIETLPGQKIALERIAWFSPLTDISADIQLVRNAVRIEAAQTRFAGGEITLDPMTLEMLPGRTMSGAVRLKQVDLGVVIAASNLASKIKVEQRVAGAIPFSFTPKSLSLTNGSIFSLGPGRLSIDRSMWSGAVASGGGNNAIRDFAFQALEHLAVEEMNGNVNSLAGGRLGVIFHIKGVNDPPISQETRIDLFDLVRGTVLEKPIPLPKNTPVDLTLDTSLNFDELLAAYRGAWSADMTAQEPPQPDGTTQ